jgi:hypothetical protein
MATPRKVPIPAPAIHKPGRGSSSIRPVPPRERNIPNVAPSGDQHPSTRTPRPKPIPQVGSTSVTHFPPPKQTYCTNLGPEPAGKPELNPTQASKPGA